MQEQTHMFSYEKIKDGIRILRCYGNSSAVTVPREIEGLPVTEIAAYAFAEEAPKGNGELAALNSEGKWCARQRETALGEQPEEAPYPCIGGAGLEELYLPGTIVRLGRYVFYNCIHLRTLSFYSNIAFMGAGAFTGCENLSYLQMIQVEHVPSCLREILADLKQNVLVDCYPKRETINWQTEIEMLTLQYRLIYPEFFEEAVENTPARIISTQTHGMGIQYRNAFRNTQVIFREYDNLFETGKYNIDLINSIRLAQARLRYPYEVEEAAEEEYRKYLKEHLRKAADYFLEQCSGSAASVKYHGENGREELQWLMETFIDSREEADMLIQAANERSHEEHFGNGEILSLLMDSYHKRFGNRKKRFAL